MKLFEFEKEMNGSKAKFSVWKELTEKGEYCCAKVAKANADKDEYGIHIADEKGNVVYYKDHLSLKAAILSDYIHGKHLKSEL